MTENEKLMREWGKRYESYISYRNQYLNTLSLSIILIGICLSVAFGSQKATPTLINLVLILAVIVLTGLFYAHVIVEKFLRKFSKRMTELEKLLSIHKFETIVLLKQAVRFTKYISILGAITISALGVLYNYNILKI